MYMYNVCHINSYNNVMYKTRAIVLYMYYDNYVQVCYINDVIA